MHQDVQQSLKRAKSRDRDDIADGRDVSTEIARKETRVEAIAQAKAWIE